MSKTVDSKVVEMRFDNAQFERNARTTMTTLEKLKGREVYRTDEQGDIVFYTDGSEIYPSSLAEAAGGDTGWIFSQAVDILRKGGF